jgi:hypothetical protein
VAGVAGAVFGLAGTLWRDGDTVARAVSIALLTGALAGEALLLSAEWARAASLVLGLELLAAATALMLASRRAPIILTLGLSLAAVAMAGAEDAARDAVRLVGWRGP